MTQGLWEASCDVSRSTPISYPQELVNHHRRKEQIRMSKDERTGWRDGEPVGWYSQFHRQAGCGAPMIDLDGLHVEFNHWKPAALNEAKKRTLNLDDCKPPDRNALRALTDLANHHRPPKRNPGLPFFATYYMPVPALDPAFRIWAINQHALNSMRTFSTSLVDKAHMRTTSDQLLPTVEVGFERQWHWMTLAWRDYVRFLYRLRLPSHWADTAMINITIMEEENRLAKIAHLADDTNITPPVHPQPLSPVA